MTKGNAQVGTLILLSEESTVPTLHLPLLLSPLSQKHTKTLLVFESKATPSNNVLPASNSTGVPKDILTPLTVPTTALPLPLEPLVMIQPSR